MVTRFHSNLLLVKHKYLIQADNSLLTVYICNDKKNTFFIYLTRDNSSI
jgi:hypothetical protein